MTSTVATLRAELRGDTAYVATPTPRLSFTVDTDEQGWSQVAAEVRSGAELVRLESAESALVAWPFAPLAPGESREVSVRVSAASGTVTDWSEPLIVEAGFLAQGAWVAQHIGLAAPAREAQPVLLRATFVVASPVRRARLYFTALGVADFALNGSPVDAGLLAPGWTSYRDRLIHETVDVTAQLHGGENVIGARLAGAWYTEKYGFFAFASRFYGDQPSVAAQLVIEYENGSTQTVTTGDGWLATGDGPVTDSGIYAGEHYDARLEQPGWSAVGFDASGWSPVRVGGVEAPVPEARIAPPVRRIEERAVQQVLRSPSGALLLDFGQNLVGWLRLSVTGPSGTVIRLRHAEVLEDGELSTRPLRNAEATDTITLAGGHLGWEPSFTFHGFRYAEIDGWPGEFDPAAVTAVVVHTDMERTGWFSSSEPLLDRLHENVVWGMRGNFLSIPTDCPQRDERLGWTGDIQVFSPTASFLYDCDAFLASWLRDLALEQERADGVVPLVVPSVLGLGFDGTAAWSDAATVVPWVLWERFGDLGVLRDQYASMRSWADVLLEQTGDTGLWAGTFQLGDWLDPSAPPDKPAQAKVDSDIVASAYLCRSLQIVADTAALLDHEFDAAHYALAAERARAAFRAEYVTPAGRMLSDAQTAYALALQFDLVTDPDVRQRLADRLAVLVRRDGYRIGTGFVGTPLVTDALADGGHLDAASRLLLQTENPSWLYPVTMGATTVWERWDSILEDGSVNPGEMTSFNHYALGAVADWMHRTVAGLAPAEPGYRRLRIAPRPLPQLEHAGAVHRTPYGVASVGWRREGALVLVTAVVPANTTASVALPGAAEFEVVAGTHEWSFADAAVPSAAGPFTLDSSTASVIDNPLAYRAAIDAIASIDPGRAEVFRRETEWVDGRTVRQSIMFAPEELYSAVADAFAGLNVQEK